MVFLVTGSRQARHQPTERQRVVGGFAQQPPGHRRRRQPPSITTCDPAKFFWAASRHATRQAGLCRITSRTVRGCLCRWRRTPATGTGSFSRSAFQPVDDRGRHALGRREHHRRGTADHGHLERARISPPFTRRRPAFVGYTASAPPPNRRPGNTLARLETIRTQSVGPPHRIRRPASIRQGRNRAVIDPVSTITRGRTYMWRDHRQLLDLFTYPLG